jgi:6-phosphogluconolactonase
MGDEAFCETPCPQWLKKLIILKIINQLDKSIKIFASPYKLAEKFAEKLISMINEAAKEKKTLSVALSGGSTPELLFSLIGDNLSKSASWEYVHFFWGDERCVPPDHPESNYGMAKTRLFEKIDIPLSNIHRIKGEGDPEGEAARYSQEILSNTRESDGLPVFDLIVLGLGEDGHTASIFPGNLHLFNSHKICEVVMHPVSLQKRITLTGSVINNSDSVIFLVTGGKKALIVEKIIKNYPTAQNFPAYFFIPMHGRLLWYIDMDAGLFL